MPGAVLLTPTTHSGATLPPKQNPRVASLAALWTFILISAGAWAGAAATRLLPDWETGRWWILTAVLDAVAVGTATLAVVIGVSALGEITRLRTVLRGTAAAAIGLALGCGLFIGSSIQAVHDWYDLDIPDAWERLELSPSGSQTIVDTARGASTARAGRLRTEGRIGGCYGGTPVEAGAEVACGEPHTLELLVQVVIPADEGAGALDRRSAGVSECATALEPRADDLPEEGEVTALVPDDVSWVAGDQSAVCLFAHPAPVRGAIGS